MKDKETDLDNYDAAFAGEEAFSKRFRRLEGDELAEHKIRLSNAVNKKKGRVTIYFDADIVHTFKTKAEQEGVGYQTLMNQALRQFIDGGDEQKAVKESLLSDKKFLKKLKKALAA